MNLLYSGKVRDIYDAGDDRLLLVTSDRISAFDVVLDRAHPRQGPGAHRPDRLLARPAGRHRPQPPRPHRRTRASDAGRACWCARPRCCPSSASCGATSPARPGRSTSATGTVHGMPLPPGLRQCRAAARARLHAVHQGRRSATTTRTSPSTRRPRSSASDVADEAARHQPGGLRAGGGPGRRRRHHHRRHQVRAGLDRRAPGPVRRGAHARLVPVLGGGRLAAGHRPRRRSTSSRCATGWRPGWDKTPAAAGPAARGGRAPRRTAYVSPTSGSPEVAVGLAADGRRRGKVTADATSRCSSRCACGPASPTPRAPPSSGPCRPSASTAWPACGWARPSASPSRRADEADGPHPGRRAVRAVLTNPVIEDTPVTIGRPT